MDIKFKPLGLTLEEIDNLVKMGLKYDKRQKKQMLAASGVILPAEQDIEKFEIRMGFVLPSDYRNFLEIKNGGIPNKSKVNVPGIGKKVVQSFYAICTPLESYNLINVIKNHKQRLPAGMLPIANDPAGNLYISDVNPGENYGKIFFWDHEQESDNEKQLYFNNISWVADSFNEFLSKLE